MGGLEWVLDNKSWIFNNKSWIFSGVGVAIIGAILGVIFKRRSTGNVNQKLKSGRNSTNIQAGRDVIDVNIGKSQGNKHEAKK